jgi:homeodomain-containing protein
VKRFNAEGIAGLEDKPKAGRPLTHPQEVRSALIALTRTKPESLGYPFKLSKNEPDWTPIIAQPESSPGERDLRLEYTQSWAGMLGAGPAIQDYLQ